MEAVEKLKKTYRSSVDTSSNKYLMVPIFIFFSLLIFALIRSPVIISQSGIGSAIMLTAPLILTTYALTFIAMAGRGGVDLSIGPFMGFINVSSIQLYAAGLFSNAFDIAVVMQMYLQGGVYDNKKILSKKNIDSFNYCYFCNEGNRRGVGFDKPQINSLDSGPTFGGASNQSFGHLGFTGTYTWADPENEIIVVFLSNRTYPSMERNLIAKHDIRTRMQQIVYEALTEK